MWNKLMRGAALLLAALLTAVLVPVPVAHAAEIDDLSAAVEEQIRAFGDSIDQSDAVNNAALALAKQGLVAGGKKLSVGENHALTAVLFNSLQLQKALIEGCASAIRAFQLMGLETLPYVHGRCGWSGSDPDKSYIEVFVYDSDVFSENKGLYRYDWALARYSAYDGVRNAYDNALDWIASGTTLDFQFRRVETTAEEMVYEVTCTVSDRFDFDTSKGSGFSKLISGIGALLFREFDWESTATFELTVPYSCSHSSGMYRWTYDGEKNTLSSDGSGGYTENATVCCSGEDSSGETAYYFELDKTVRLSHEEPWVLEYDVKNSGDVAFSPMEFAVHARPSLVSFAGNALFVWDRERVQVSEAIMKEYKLKYRNQWIRNYYGTDLSGLTDYSAEETYTFRLENEVKADGSNMIYLTVRSTDTGEVLLERVPMDGYYRYEEWVKETLFQNETSDWVSGEDLLINYIGTADYPLSADCFELRIWENGENAEATGCRGGVCPHCGFDTVTAALEGNILTLTGELEAGTKILVACYDGGRLVGSKLFLWQGSEIKEELPAGEEITIFFLNENWMPLREQITF